MTDLVATDDIERIVDARRDPLDHLGRAVSAERKVYILHSRQCSDLHEAGSRDLRDCPFSVALDEHGINPRDWPHDEPVVLELVRQGDQQRLGWAMRL